MATGYEWLESIASGMKAAAAQGVVPTSEQLTVRELVRHFGYLIRGPWVNDDIRNALEEHNLKVSPNFEYVWLDETIAISLNSSTSDDSKPQIEFDPTRRIGSLEAANKKPQSVKPESPLNDATTVMLLYNYSQLPVMTGERHVSGMISWKSMSSHLSMGETCTLVKDCMEEAQVVPANAPLFDAISAIAEHDYVLVRAADNVITGIVTASDLSLQFMQLAGPFLFVGEIEGYLRHLVHGKFTVEELGEFSDGQRRIEGIGDLTLGGYLHLLSDGDNWNRLGLNISREKFVDVLEEVRQARNDLMHFSPDGLLASETDKLRDMARFLRGLANIGAI